MVKRVIFLLIASVGMILANADSNDPRSKIHQWIKDQYDVYRETGIIEAHISAIEGMPAKVKKRFQIARYQIIDNQLYGQYYGTNGNIERFNIMSEALKKCLVKYTIPNIDFFIILSDGLYEKENNLAKYGESMKMLANSPVFAFSKNTELEKGLLLLPDIYILAKNWDNFLQSIRNASDKHGFEAKENLIFWRGTTTGGSYDLSNFMRLPRLKLVMLSLFYPKIIDAKFTSLDRFPKSIEGYLLKFFLKDIKATAGYVSPEDHLKFKYLISLDGNTTAWGRVPWILMSNSVLLKQETNDIQYFYAGLEKDVNYVAIKEDLSDVFEKFTWLNSHQPETKQIAENGTKFALENLTIDKILEDMSLILIEYGKLQKFTISKSTFHKVQ